MVARANRWGIVLLGMLVLLVAACGGEAEPLPTATPTETPSPTATIAITPRPTSTPLPRATEPPPSGGLTTTLNVLCSLGEYGLDLRVRYGTRIRDTDNPAATITRVRVFVDGVLKEDSGPLSHRIFVKEAHFVGLPSRAHAVQLRVDTWAAPPVRDVVQIAVCPPIPDTPLAQVVS